ncbi:MAG TPA: E3 binding domain-containing protein, partial [Nitrosomonas sp.]|nr:E3 binding domain-containing protein [Nitrosomonas sp.]
MLIEIKVPQLSESVAEATLISWHKKQGEKVVRGENLIDIETDKVVLELPATQDGILIEILKNDGATVKSGEIIAKIETEMTSTASVSSSLTINQGTVKPKPETKNQIAKILMPAAQKMAEENQLKQNEVNSIVGTGREGRVTKEDIANHIKSKPQTAEVTSTPASILSEVPNMEQLASNTERLEQRVPMTRLRMRIAERLVQSQSTAAILTTFNEVNM